jgi:antitoxin ParD1/3/4
MATMNISLPDKMKQWVEQQAKTGRYSNASDYVRDLIRRDEGAGPGSGGIAAGDRQGLGQWYQLSELG